MMQDDSRLLVMAQLFYILGENFSFRAGAAYKFNIKWKH